MELKNWPHPAEAAAIIDVKEYEGQSIQIYTDGSKNELGVGSGVAIFTGKELVTQQNTSQATDAPVIKLSS